MDSKTGHACRKYFILGDGGNSLWNTDEEYICTLGGMEGVEETLLCYDWQTEAMYADV